MSSQPGRVVFIQHKTKLRPVLPPDQYQLRRDRSAVWLQRLCVWVLRKLGAHAVVEVEDVTPVEFYSDDLISALNRQRQEVSGRFGHKPARLVIGAEDFRRLMNTPEIHQYVQINTQYRGHTVLGLRVEIVPWMRGMVVLP